MSLRQLFQILKRSGTVSVLPDAFLRAVEKVLSSGSQRRSKGRLASSRGESLEIRQVLSAFSPVVSVFGSDSDLLQAESLSTEVQFRPELSSELNAESELLDAFRRQLLSVLDGSTELSGEMIPASPQGRYDSLSTESLGGGLLARAETPEPETAEQGSVIGTTSDVVEVSLPDSTLSFTVVLDWSEGPSSIEVISISSVEFQVNWKGLGESSVVGFSKEYAEQLVYESTIQVLQSVRPGRSVRISFVDPTRGNSPHFAGPSAENESVANNAGQKETRKPAPEPPEVSLPPADVLTDTGVSVADAVGDSRLIDDVFGESSSSLTGLILSESSQSRPSDYIGVTIARSETRWTPDQYGSQSRIHVLVAQDDTGATNVPGRPGRFTRRHGKLLLSRVEFASDESGLSSPAGSVVANPNQMFSSLRLADAVHSERTAEWFDWLMNAPATVAQWKGNGASVFAGPSRHFASAVPVLSSEASGAIESRTSVSGDSLQSRRYREHVRQAALVAGPRQVWGNDHEVSLLPESGSIPRELRYVANPRGPPVYGRDADVPLSDGNGPADLLERLRYSIAPRGPSLVTVEMQSPEFKFSSGPRVSSEVTCSLMVC